MKCGEFETRLHELLDARQHPEDDARLRGHASTCDSCCQVLQTQERLFYALAQRSVPESSPQLARRVLDEIQPNRHSPRRRSWGQSPLLLAAAAIAALLLVALLPIFQSGTSPTPVAERLGQPGNSDEESRQTQQAAATEQDRLANFDLPPETRLSPAVAEIPVPDEAAPDPSRSLAAATEPNELYRRWLIEVTEQMQRISTDATLPVDELTSNF